MKGEKEGIDILNGERIISDLPFVYRAHNYFSLNTKHTQIVFCVIPTVDPIPDGISFRISGWKGEYFQVICKNVIDLNLIYKETGGIIKPGMTRLVLLEVRGITNVKFPIELKSSQIAS